MKTVINTSTNPYFNLALEEYLLKEFSLHDDLFYVWRNDPCVVVGRNQNPFNEIHLNYADSHHIPVIRRISGGGAVYHDLGNINFTYITKNISKRLNNYRFFVQPIIDILERTGLPVRFVESSHIYLGDTKISGNAQSFHKNKMLHHGTLLFDSDLEHLTNILKIQKTYESHAVNSTHSQTRNIKEVLQVDTTIEEFMEFLLSEMLMGDYTNNTITLQDKDIKEITQLAKTKYQSWNWNIGETPSFSVHKTIDGETIDIEVVKGMIQQSSIYPDILEGIRFHQEDINNALTSYPQAQKWIQTLFM